MPIYEYRCERCGAEFEHRERINDRRLKTCPKCGGIAYRVIRPAGIIFKGSGFYATDYRQAKPQASAPSDKTRATEEGESH